MTSGWGCMNLAKSEAPAVPVRVSRRVLNDSRLSLAARGLYALITLADEQLNRYVPFAGLRNAVELDTTEAATCTALGELVAAGHAMVREGKVTMLTP